MRDIVKRVILAYKRRLVRKVKRRSALQRYKARLYYRRNKVKLKIWRKKYLRRNKIFLKTRNLFKRTKPVWLFKRKRKYIYKPKFLKKKRIHIPKVKRRIYVSKRRRRK